MPDDPAPDDLRRLRQMERRRRRAESTAAELRVEVDDLATEVADRVGWDLVADALRLPGDVVDTSTVRVSIWRRRRKRDDPPG